MSNIQTNSFIKRGFTLVELIVVIAILGILAAIAMPSFSGLIEQSKIAVDNANLKTLNNATVYYAANEKISIEDVFSGITTDENRMQKLIDEEYLENIITAKQKDAFFAWNIIDNVWEIIIGDPIVIAFKDAINDSPLTYSDFLGKFKNYASYNSNYQPNYWNGYLEKILETGDVESNSRVVANEGTNTIGYKNPFSKKATVVNYSSWESVKNIELVKNPGIFITKDSNFNHSALNHTYIQNNINTLKGTMVFYKEDSKDNSETQVYYIKEDGTLSDLIPIDEVLK